MNEPEDSKLCFWFTMTIPILQTHSSDNDQKPRGLSHLCLLLTICPYGNTLRPFLLRGV